MYLIGATMFVLFNIITFGSIYIWSFGNDKVKKLRVENRSARIAIQPLLFAEKDRL